MDTGDEGVSGKTVRCLESGRPGPRPRAPTREPAITATGSSTAIRTRAVCGMSAPSLAGCWTPAGSSRRDEGGRLPKVLNSADRSNGRRRFVGSAKLHASALSIVAIKLLIFFFIDLEMSGCAVSRQAKSVTASWRWRTLFRPGMRKAAPLVTGQTPRQGCGSPPHRRSRSNGPIERRTRARHREDLAAQEANRLVIWTHQVDVFASAGESVEGSAAV